jgi:hypothetical protein
LQRQKEHVRKERGVLIQNWGQNRNASWNVKNLMSGIAERKRQKGIKAGEDRAPETALTLLTVAQYGKTSSAS